MAKEKFDRSKSHCNICIIGLVEHGKTTLTAAISTTLAAKGFESTKSSDEIETLPEEKARDITINTSHVEFTTAERHYSLVDCLGYADYVKNLVTGAVPVDGAILIVDATDGSMSKIREQILLANQVGVPKIVVFMNNCDKVDKAEFLNVVETEVRELLSKYGFDGANTPIIRGSALRALEGDSDYQDKVMELMDACDLYIPIPLRDVDKPFLMAIADVITITGRGTVATGRIERGVVRTGDSVDCVGLGAKNSYTVVGVEMFQKMLDEGQAGDNVGLLLRNARKEDLVRGKVLAAPNSVATCVEFKAEIYVLKKNEGGRETPFMNGYRSQFFFRTTDVTGTIQLPEGIEKVYPGDSVTIKVKLDTSIAMEKQLRFAIREGGIFIASGIVSELITSDYGCSANTSETPIDISGIKVSDYNVPSKINSILGNIPAYHPLALFPVRLETSFCYINNNKQKQLRVRIIPDEIMLDYKKNSKLTEDEIKDGKFFWIQWYIASGCESREYEAWENLCSKYPLYKAARICRELKPTDINKDKFNCRRPYVNNANGENVQQSSSIELIETKCRKIYDILADVNFDERKFLEEKDKDEETSFEKSIRKNLSEINAFVFEIESLMLPCDMIVDYLYDNVHETFLYLYRRLQVLYSIYQKQSCLSTPRSLELWDIDYSILKSLLEKTEKFLESLDNRCISLSDMVNLYLQKEKIDFPTISAGRSDALNIPVCKCLPDYFVFVGEVANNAKNVVFAVSNKVDASKIQMGFSEKSKNSQNDGLDANSGELNLADNPKMKWMTDYETARQCGMAITVDIDKDVNEFRYIYVLGVANLSDSNRRSVISDLVYGHNYINSNMRFVKAGTPTNIIDGKYEDEEDFLRHARYEIEVKQSYMNERYTSSLSDYNICDSMKIAYLLKGHGNSACYEKDFLEDWSRIVGFDNAQDRYTEIAYENLWDKYLGGVFKDDLSVGTIPIKKFFVKHVRARGNVATLRIDNLPYGILPTTDFVQMIKILLDNNGNVSLKNLLYSLIQLAEEWKKCRNNNVKYSEKMSGTKSQQNYLEMTGQTPYSVNFTERTLIESKFNPSYLDADAGKANANNVRKMTIIGNFLKEENLGAVPIADVYDFFENKDKDVFKEMVSCVYQALKNNGMPAEECNRESELLVSEFFDLLTHRLDAWFMGILDYYFHEKIGIVDSPYIGTFGWVFNLKENPRTEITGKTKADILEKMQFKGPTDSLALFESSQDGHFIVAPSIQHALTATVLRSSYIKSKSQKNSESQICVNLSSTRVRQAMRLVDGVKSGMALSIILGSDFERYLHEARKIYKIKVNNKEIPAEMDEFIYPLRQLFPQVVNLEAGDNRANDYIMQVVNAEALLNAFVDKWAWSKPVSEWLQSEWDNRDNSKNTPCALIQRLIVGIEKYELNPSKFSVLFKIIERLMDSYDALNDLLLSEGVHRLIMGDKASYYAINNFLKSKEGNLPDMDILNIPSEHVVVSHKAGVLLPQSTKTSDKVLCRAEPALNAWIEDQLGGMENILFFVKKEKENAVQIVRCSLAELKISGIEYMYLSAFDKSFHVYLESRFRELKSCTSDKIFVLDSALDAGYECKSNEISLEDNALRIETLRSLVAHGRVMNTADWHNQMCEDKTEEELIDIDDLKNRVSYSCASLENIKNNLENWLTITKFKDVLKNPVDSNKKTDAIDDELVAEGYKLLCDCFESGMINCFNEYDLSAFMGALTQDSDADEYERICDAQKVLGSDVYNAYNDLCDRIKSAQEIVESNTSAETCITALQSITLSNFKVCYKFKAESVINAFKNPLKNTFVGAEKHYYTNVTTDLFDQWQDEVSEVRDGMKLMHQLHMTQMALDRDLDNVAILQTSIPDGADCSDVVSDYKIWLGAGVNNESELRDADSLVLYNASAYTTCRNGCLSGFVFDSWIEYIPYQKHDAGLAFHNDWPNAEAPQSILLAWHPKLPLVKDSRETSTWNLKTLLQVVRSTRFMMMNRAVEPDYIYRDPLLSKIFPLTPKTKKEISA